MKLFTLDLFPLFILLATSLNAKVVNSQNPSKSVIESLLAACLFV